jgi:pimeloyl-ACP methyl ester carboxylesterase
MSLGLIAGLIRDRPHEADVLERIRRMVETEQSAARLMARIRGAFASGPADRIRIDEAKLTIVDCSDDPLVSPAMRDQLPIRYPGARHVRLESGGHFAVMTQAPRLAALVRERPRSGPAFS